MNKLDSPGVDVGKTEARHPGSHTQRVRQLEVAVVVARLNSVHRQATSPCTARYERARLLAKIRLKECKTRMWANAQPDGRPAEYR